MASAAGGGPSLWRELQSSRAFLVFPIIFLELAQAGMLFPILPGFVRGPDADSGPLGRGLTPNPIARCAA